MAFDLAQQRVAGAQADAALVIGAADDAASSPVDIPETENSDFEIPSTSLEEPTSNLRIMPVVDALLMSGGTNQDVLTDMCFLWTVGRY